MNPIMFVRQILQNLREMKEEQENAKRVKTWEANRTKLEAEASITLAERYNGPSGARWGKEPYFDRPYSPLVNDVILSALAMTYDLKRTEHHITLLTSRVVVVFRRSRNMWAWGSEGKVLPQFPGALDHAPYFLGRNVPAPLFVWNGEQPSRITALLGEEIIELMVAAGYYQAVALLSKPIE